MNDPRIKRVLTSVKLLSSILELYSRKWYEPAVFPSYVFDITITGILYAYIYH